MRIGLLSDLHHERPPRAARRWINDYDPARVLARVAAALAWFDRQDVERVVVAGDLVEVAAGDAYDEVLQALAGGALQVALVGGNHDWSDDGLLARKAREHNCRLLDASPEDGLAGVAAAPRPLFATTSPPATDALVTVSHFPLISEAARLASAGLPYPGDLTDRAVAATVLKATATPRLVLCGHIHARCARAEGNVLQLGAAALVEPPYEAAVVTVSPDGGEATRRARRFGPVAAVDPVFAASYERWQWDDQWRRVEWHDADMGAE